jgi:glyoxylase-like metal-dependent hydrolase (beta-lactamase superfamily II)
MDFDYDIANELGNGVRRLVARNPGPMTFKGTNTYLVGRSEVAVIDPGPDDLIHRQAILAAANGAPITHILLTHTHRDHSDGVAALQAATGAATCGFGAAGKRRDSAAQHSAARAILETSFVPAIRMGDGDTVKGADWALKAIHTPGHAPDHLCFELAGTGVLFSGDHVMGWNTTVVAPPEGRMSDYIASLEKLIGPGAVRQTVYYAGHGEAIHEPGRLVRSFLMHRQMRETMIRDCLSQGMSHVDEITDRIYRGISVGLIKVARLSVLAHLEHLVEKGLVSCDAEPSLNQQFRLTA